MLAQSKETRDAWRASQRTLDIKVTIDGKTYGATDINSLKYDSGAYNGDTFAIGSTYSNNVQIEFSHLIEGLKLGMEVRPSIGIKTSSGYVYEPLGVFIISSEIKMDRNNNLTTVSASDRFCGLEGSYVSKLTYPAKVLDVIAEICAQSGVKANANDLARLPHQEDLTAPITGQSYRKALGWIAQLYVGYALFDRQGLFTIRTISEPNYELDPSQYEQAGLDKNEAAYKINGIQCQVTTITKTRDGESAEETKTYQAGDATGSQIKLENNIMTPKRLNDIWEQLKDLTFYPFSLNWFGNPAVEAGDWLRLEDKQGNSFVVPNSSYTLDFNGGLSATSKADQTTSSDQMVPWQGSVAQTIKELQLRRSPDGTVVFPPSVTEPPANAKFNDVWFKKNGNSTELWIFEKQDNGSGKWICKDLSDDEIKKKVADAQQGLNQAKADIISNKQKADADIENLNKSIEANKSAADESIENLNKSIEANKSAADESIEKLNKSIEANKSAADESIEKLNKSIADNKKVADDSLQKLSDSITKLQGQYDNNIVPDLTKVTNDVADALQKYISAQNNIADLTKQAQAQGKNIADVTNTVKGLNINYANLLGDVNSTKVDVKGLQTTVGTANGDIAQLKLDAQNLQTMLAGKVDNTTYTNFVNLTNQALNARLTASDLNGYAKMVDVQATANGLRVDLNSVTDRMNNLKVGTSNLLHHSDTFDGWHKEASVSVTSNKYLNGNIAVLKNTGSGANALNTDLDGPYDSQTVSWTVYAKADNAGDKLHTELWGGGGSTDQSLTTEWQSYKFTGQRDARSHAFYLWGCQGNKGNVYVALPFAVVGNSIGTWGPNASDIDHDLEELSAQVNITNQQFSSYYTKSEADNRTNSAKNDAVNAIKSDSSWQGLNNILTNSGFLQTADGFLQKVQQTTQPMIDANNGGGINLLKKTNFANETLADLKDAWGQWFTLRDDKAMQLDALNSSTSTDAVQLVPVEPDTDYTLSFEVNYSEITKGGAWSKIRTYMVERKDKDTNTTNYVDHSRNVINTNKRQDNIYTIHTQKECHYLLVFFRAGEKTLFSFVRPKLEKGRVSTPYSPAPSDNVTQIAFTELTQSLDGLRSTVGSNYGSLQSQISQSSSSIRTELTDKIKDIDNKTTSTADSLNSVIGRVGSLENLTNFQVINNAINANDYTNTGNYFIQSTSNTNVPATNWCYLKVEKVNDGRIVQTWQADSDPTLRYVRTKFGDLWTDWQRDASYSEYSVLNQTVQGLQSTVSSNYGALQTQINQTATAIRGELYDQISGVTNQITATANGIDARIGSLTIGGENLLHNSDTFEGWYKSPAITISSDKYLNGNVAVLTPNTGGITLGSNADKTTSDTSLTWTVYAKADNAGDKLHTELWGGGGSTDQSLTTEWKKYKFSGKQNKNDTSFYLWGCQSNVGNVYVSLPMLYSGSIDRDWSANSADMATKADFTKVNATINGLQSTVGSNYSTLQSQINQTAAAIRSELTDSTSGLQNQITATANGLDLTIKNLVVGGGNLLHNSDTFDGWSINGTVKIDDSMYLNGKIAVLTPGNGTSNELLASSFDGPLTDETATWVIYAKADNAGDKLHTELFGGGGLTNQSLTTEWQKYKFTGHRDKRLKQLHFWGLAENQGNIYIALPILSEGSVEKTWEPNPADMATRKDFASLNVTLQGLQSTVSSNYGTLQSQISQTASAIRSELADQVTGVTNQITTTANGLNARIGSLTIGGENLLHNSDTFERWGKGTSVAILSDNYLNGAVAVLSPGGSGGNSLTSDADKVASDTSLTWTVYAKADNAGDKLHTELWGGGGITDQTLTTEWKKYKFSGKQNQNNRGFYLWGCQGNAGNVYVALPMLYSGSIDRDWSANSADMATKADFTEVTATINGLQSTVSGNYSTLQTQINQTATTIRGEITNSVSGLQTQITQQANNFNVSLNSLRSETAWQKVTSAIDANNYKTTGNYWIQAAPNSNTPDSSAWAYLQVVAYPDVKRIKQTWQRDNNENEIYTRLLIEDNWTSWQRTVTGGNIMAQINMSAGTTLIQNDKIYMDASSTVFSGNAFIPSAAITSLTADKITAGTINGAKVNVINLNANNITAGTLRGSNGEFYLDSGSLHVWQNNHDAWINQNGIHDYDNQRSVWIQKGEINFEHRLGGSMKHTGVILTNSENSNLNGAITIKGDEGFLLSTKNFTTNYWSEQGFSWGTNTAHYVSGSGILGFNNNITVSAGSTDDHSIAALIAGAIPSKNLGNIFGVRAQPGVYIYGRNDSNKDHSFVDIKAPASIHLTTLDSYITIGDTNGSERDSDVSINSGNYLTVSADNSINITACSKTKADLMPGISLSEASTSISGNSITLNAKNYVTLLGSSVSVTGDFGVLGKKNAIVPTSRGMAAINAYETAEYYFGDIGETQTNSNGVVTVMIDPYFLETVNTLVPYQVFLTPYGNGNVWVSSRSANNFTVKSSNPNIHFAWEIKAKRKGYENDRMKIVKGVFNNEQY